MACQSPQGNTSSRPDTAAAAPATTGGGQVVRRNDDGTFTLRLEDADLGTTLKRLAAAARMKIRDGYQGKVTASLENVTFYEALDACAAQSGLIYVNEGSSIYLMTRQEYEEMLGAAPADE